MDEIAAALAQGRLDTAAGLALAAVRRGVASKLALRVAADALAARGGFGEALALFQRARMIEPSDVSTLVGLGLCLGKLRRHREAVEALEAALRLDPDNAPAHGGLGECFVPLGALQASIVHYRRAVELDPDKVEALAGLATVLVTIGEVGEARAQARRALQLAPDDPVAGYALARCELADKAFAEAEAVLRPLVEGAADRGRQAGLRLALGEALHGQGRAAEAYEAVEAANRTKAEIWRPMLAPATARFLAMVAMLGERFADEGCAAVWRDPPPESREDVAACRTHAFLVGFPRSGTTLLEQVLAAHPEVEALDEAPAIMPAAQRFFRGPEGLEELARLDARDAGALRAQYWKAVRAAGARPEGKVFVDKAPMSSLNLPVIAKLFPRARILFAVRDPRDVALSCFRQDFAVNPATFAMLTLQGAAGLYDQVMRAAEAYRPRSPLPLMEVRYERLVERFEAETRAVLGFLDLDWDDRVRDFADSLVARAVATPSAPQIRRGLYKGGEGQWRAYAEQMQAVAPVLQPWVERFGYGA